MSKPLSSFGTDDVLSCGMAEVERRLSPPEIIAQEISDDLEAALEQFATIADDSKK